MITKKSLRRSLDILIQTIDVHRLNNKLAEALLKERLAVLELKISELEQTIKEKAHKQKKGK